MMHPFIKHLLTIPNARGLFLLALWEISGKGWIERSRIIDSIDISEANRKQHKKVALDLVKLDFIETKLEPNRHNQGTTMIKITNKGIAWLQEGYKLTKEKQLCK